MIVIVGPTAVGKSALALQLARVFDAEVINADSRQVYRHMDIGTGKPSPAEQATVTHHIIDVVDPDEEFSLAMYHELAVVAVRAIERRGRLPFLVGGSGLYVWSVVEGWRIPQVPPDRELRRRFEIRAEQEGGEGLYRELQQVDPLAAERIDPGNVRRIIRALEIHHATGLRPSHLQVKQAPDCPLLLIGLTQDRAELYARIDRRVDRMIQIGLVDEVEQLLKKGYGPALPSMSGIGYRQIAQVLGGEVTLAEATDKIKQETHRLARRQYAWFRLSDSRIHWFTVEGSDPGWESGSCGSMFGGVRSLIEGFIRSGSLSG
jgi:tRNA dimethylallyltransferase